MSGFFCPTCQMVRHIDEEDDPREDHCWRCGTRVPYTEGELRDMREACADADEQAALGHFERGSNEPAS